MATTQKSNSERSSGADGKSICPGCSDRFGKARTAQRVLRGLLSTDVSSGYYAGNQIGVATIQGRSPVHVSPAASATFPYTRGRVADTNANGHARTEKAGAQTQKEILIRSSRRHLASSRSIRYSYTHLFLWRVRLVVRTQPSQGWCTGSTPVRAAICGMQKKQTASRELISLPHS